MVLKYVSLVLLATTLGCSSGSSTRGTGGMGGSGGAGGLAIASLFDTRYCEILLADVAGDTATISVFNTVGLNDCPADLWDAVDVEQIAQEQEAFLALQNGPRYWTVDAAAGGDTVTGEFEVLGGIEMQKVGEIQLALARALELQSSVDPYADVTVNRDNTWVFNAGREVYELVDPEGSIYIMQSYSHQVDDALTGADLPTLGERLDLPANWSFQARVLTSELTVQATGQATVTQDELRNTYQKR